ncbi:hypothetical protein, conserved [Babesia bigemina]|uniref:PWI domain containing protein n=1 Tax=Babesia bigemina TaxID=5866 RepID=A0A061D4Q2_BABBI|nr:hypothetical protein, conserved [Babesia bigemina]CDR95027.1 hypothetical protein, conserved [Babesia bigemina]|eukprot:XP_012767213.1 hypothetical protein, conserved [Babesia bigemina]
MSAPDMNGMMMPPCPPPPGMEISEAAYPAPPAVIAKGPSAPTAPVGYSSNVVPGLIDTLMMPATVALPVQDPEPPPMVNVVYVGGLHSGTSSDFVINIMQKCGKLINFKRHADPSSGLLANFALCEFESPRGAYYAMECLANLPFGDGQVKVSCNDRVRGLVEEWVTEQISGLRDDHPDMSDDELREIFKAPEAELRRSFENLIKYEVRDIQAGGPSAASSRGDVVRAPRRTDHRSDSATTVKNSDAANESQHLTSKEYTVHPKECARRSKFKSRQREKDDIFRREEREWLMEEASLLRKLQRIGTVRRSTRERLVKEDLEGFARSTSSRERDREREMDLEDAREEALELSSSEARCTIPLAAPVVQQPPAEPPKHALPTVFGNAADEDEPIFNRSHRPQIQLGLPDAEIWARVPKDEADVFAYPLDWDRILSDGGLFSSIEPWMRGCVSELMGDDESVVGEVLEFLAGRLVERPGPTELLSDVEQFMDDESQRFVLELWRRLIYHQLRLGEPPAS